MSKNQVVRVKAPQKRDDELAECANYSWHFQSGIKIAEAHVGIFHVLECEFDKPNLTLSFSLIETQEVDADKAPGERRVRSLTTDYSRRSRSLQIKCVQSIIPHVLSMRCVCVCVCLCARKPGDFMTTQSRRLCNKTAKMCLCGPGITLF